MCIYTPEVHPGLAGIIDHIDVINDVKAKVSPILALIVLSDGSLPKEDISSLVNLCYDMLDHAWRAAEGIYGIYKKEVAHAD